MRESLENCLRREIREEANIENFLLFEEVLELEWGHWISFCYHGIYKSGEVRVNEPDKHEEIGWFNIDNLPKMSPYGRRAIEEYERRYL
jgi:ADP-ribose pyrophosphatase YjhB (NUDIX family)